MDFSAVCRLCLSENSLNPIFLNPKEHSRYASAVFVATGIKVAVNDGLPQRMCTNCIKYVNDTLKFRKRCQDTEQYLLKIKNSIGSNEIDIVKTETPKLTQDNDVDIEFTNEADSDEDDKPLQYLLEGNSGDADPTVHQSEAIREVIKETKPIIDADKNVETNEKSAFILDEGNVKRVRCQICHKNLSVHSIAGHMTRRHPGVNREKQSLRCGYCKIEFDSKEVLIEHVTTCTAKKTKRKTNESGRQLRECDVCHKIMQKASLRMHKAIKHAGLGPVCEHCGRRFGNKFRLNEHYRAKHGYDKFKCSYCEFQSASALAMRNHERRHRGEKPFVCETCGAKFHAAYLLSQHKQSHRTEKLVKCDLCPASFKANNSLHMHKLTCHSTSLYKCTMCSRVYSCRHYAVKHLRHVHHFTGTVPPLQKIDPESQQD